MPPVRSSIAVARPAFPRTPPIDPAAGGACLRAAFRVQCRPPYPTAG